MSDASERYHVYEDADSQAAASALQTHLQKHCQAYLSDAVAVAAHAPLFVKELVQLVKQKSQETVEPVEEATSSTSKKKKTPKGKAIPSLGLSFENQVLAYLSTANINFLVPILESVGLGHDRPQTLRLLTVVTVAEHTLLAVIRWLEKLGFSRNRVGDIIEKQYGVLPYSRDEIEEGYAMLKSLSLSEKEIEKVIMKYPLIMKCVDKIDSLRQELFRFPSRDIVLRKATTQSSLLYS
ncbi:hypothetical protein L7F22_005274 [Adiantum nelumboides]|nr:hypothetical protein [Adiantum nelumboides]